MNQFSTLIEYLLLNHNYVVIPGLGTFIVQQVEATRNEVDEEFLPPYRSVRFNTDLAHDDDLVVNTIAETFHISTAEAGQKLGTWLTDFTQTLEDEGSVDFGAIGMFTTENGKLHLTTHESGVTTPEYYGLDAFHFRTVEEQAKAKVVPITASMETDDKAIVIRINRRIANFVAVACAAILMFIVFNTPSQYENGLELRSSIHKLLFPTVPTLTTVETSETTTTEVTPKETKNVQTEVAPAEIAPAVEPEHEYYIVLASAISMKNAERFVGKLNDDGFVSARIITSGSMTRVVVGHYPTEEEANHAAREIRQRSADYRDAWVSHR